MNGPEHIDHFGQAIFEAQSLRGAKLQAMTDGLNRAIQRNPRA
jgi:hypothetical protein